MLEGMDIGRSRTAEVCGVPLEYLALLRLNIETERYKARLDKELDSMIDASMLGDGED